MTGSPRDLETYSRVNHHNLPAALLLPSEMANGREPVFPDTGIALACGKELVRGRTVAQVFTVQGVGDLDQLVIAVAILDASL
jgi:hypothetical protein